MSIGLLAACCSGKISLHSAAAG